MFFLHDLLILPDFVGVDAAVVEREDDEPSRGQGLLTFVR